MQCPNCRSLSEPARCDERQADDTFKPGDYVRCINCKHVWYSPRTYRADILGRPITVASEYDAEVVKEAHLELSKLKLENVKLKKDISALIVLSLAMNDKLEISCDHVEYTGGMNQAEDFREQVNAVWHKYEFPKKSTQTL